MTSLHVPYRIVRYLMALTGCTVDMKGALCVDPLSPVDMIVKTTSPEPGPFDVGDVPFIVRSKACGTTDFPGPDDIEYARQLTEITGGSDMLFFSDTYIYKITVMPSKGWSTHALYCNLVKHFGEASGPVFQEKWFAVLGAYGVMITRQFLQDPLDVHRG